MPDFPEDDLKSAVYNQVPFKEPVFAADRDEEKAEHIRTSCFFSDKPDDEESYVTAKIVTIRRPSRVEYMKI